MDFFLELSRNPAAKSMIRGLGLPIPQPPVLKRSRTRWQQRILGDETVVVFGDETSELLGSVAQTLARSGARVAFSGAVHAAAAFRDPSEAWGEPLKLQPLPLEGERVHGFVFDASGLRSLDQLSQLYTAIAPWVRSLKSCGRVVVLARPVGDAPPELAAVRQSLEGFVRSLAKELGRKGTTANLIRVAENAEGRVQGVLRFLLSRFSAFVTAQPFDVDDTATSNDALQCEQALFGKRCLVTGAARGIGKATAMALAREGAHVIIVDRPDAEADASRLASALGGSVLLLDIATDDAAERLTEHLEEHGGVDVVIHNAGVTRDRTLGRMKEEQWELVLDVNLRAATRLTRALLDRKQLNDRGRLVFLASVSGIAGNPGQTNYATSKSGLIGYTRALAGEVANRGITVNAIAPGLIETKMTQAMPAGVREAARRLAALNQGGLPEDVAEAITFLALPDSDGMTGRVLRVCGGALVGA